MMKIILASASPRRRELISRLGLDYAFRACEVDETLSDALSPEENALHVAEKKALKAFEEGVESDEIILAADTVVVSGKRIIGKPSSETEAFNTLKSLSARKHEVITGVCMMGRGKKIMFYDKSYVTFKRLSDKEIFAYIETGEPLDKAGSYAVQGKGALFVKAIEGSYFNIVGLPLNLLYEHLKNDFGCDIDDIFNDTEK